MSNTSAIFTEEHNIQTPCKLFVVGDPQVLLIQPSARHEEKNDGVRREVDLIEMSFSHSNLPAIPKLPVDTIFQNHRVTYNRNDYEFVWYYKTFPSIQIPDGMHVCNC